MIHRCTYLDTLALSFPHQTTGTYITLQTLKRNTEELSLSEFSYLYLLLCLKKGAFQLNPYTINASSKAYLALICYEVLRGGA